VINRALQKLVMLILALVFVFYTGSMFTASLSFAKNTCDGLRVSAVKIPHFSENEHKGVFIDMIRQAALRAGLAIEINVYPKKRAVKVFAAKSANVYLPRASDGPELISHKSLPIFTRRDFAFVREGTAVPKSILDLEGRSVGLTRNYIYSKRLLQNNNIKFIYAPNDRQNIKMLDEGRFDVSIIEEFSGLKAVKQARVKNILFDKQYPISDLVIWVLFEKSDCGLIYRDKINAAFKAMKRDGRWAAIFKDRK